MHKKKKINLHYPNRNLHCDIQQFPQLNPSHRVKEYQHLALSTLNTKSNTIIQLTHSQNILLSLFWLLLLITGTTDICNIVFRGAWRGISWQTKTFINTKVIFTESSMWTYLMYIEWQEMKWKTLSKKHFVFLCITIKCYNLFTYCQRLQSRLVREDFEPGIKRGNKSASNGHMITWRLDGRKPKTSLTKSMDWIQEALKVSRLCLFYQKHIFSCKHLNYLIFIQNHQKHVL